MRTETKRVVPKLTPPRSWAAPHDHLRTLLTDPWYAAVVALQDVVSRQTTSYWGELGVRAIHLPVTTTSVSSPMGLGSDSLPVAVSLFGAETYLADSMQFMLELGCRLSPSGCYYILPTFRGEAPDAAHLCQFFHSEAELPVGLEGLIARIEGYLAHLCRGLLDDTGDVVEQAAGTVEHVLRLQSGRPLPRIAFADAVEQLRGDERFFPIHKAGFRTITRAGERRLIGEFGGPVWLTNFDRMAVPFYQAAHPADPTKAANADLIMGGVEIVGAGERHSTGGAVREALGDHGVDETPYRWYIEMKDAAPMRTSGFGLGVERFLVWALGHDDVRDVALLQRVNGVVLEP